MKNKSLLMIVLMLFTFSMINAQELPPKHRGMHPRLQADGKVVDEGGRQLGFISKEGKVCDVTGKTLGVIANTGEVSYANGKGIVGMIQKDGSFKSKKGHVVTTDSDGAVKVAGKAVAFVETGYSNKSHGCALHCFFSSQNEDAKSIDKNLNQ